MQIQNLGSDQRTKYPLQTLFLSKNLNTLQFLHEAAEDYEATSSKTFVSRRHPELLLGASQWDHQGK